MAASGGGNPPNWRFFQVFGEEQAEGTGVEDVQEGDCLRLRRLAGRLAGLALEGLGAVAGRRTVDCGAGCRRPAADSRSGEPGRPCGPEY